MPRKRDKRPLHLKIRVLAPKGATRNDVLRVVKRAASTGFLEAPYQLRWLDWTKGSSGRASSGHIEPLMQEQLESFALAMEAMGNLRAAPVTPETVGPQRPRPTQIPGAGL